MPCSCSHSVMAAACRPRSRSHISGRRRRGKPAFAAAGDFGSGRPAGRSAVTHTEFACNPGSGLTFPADDVADAGHLGACVPTKSGDAIHQLIHGKSRRPMSPCPSAGPHRVSNACIAHRTTPRKGNSNMINATRPAMFGVSAFAAFALTAGGGVASASTVHPASTLRPGSHCQLQVRYGTRHRDHYGHNWCKLVRLVQPISVSCGPFRSEVISVVLRGNGRCRPAMRPGPLRQAAAQVRRCCPAIRPGPLRQALPVRGCRTAVSIPSFHPAPRAGQIPIPPFHPALPSGAQIPIPPLCPAPPGADWPGSHTAGGLGYGHDSHGADRLSHAHRLT